MNEILALAIDEMNQKNFTQAKAILESLLSKDPNNAHVLFHLGRCNCKMKHYDAAIKLFEKCIKLDPDQEKVYKALHCVYGKAGILQKIAPEGEVIGFEDLSLYFDRAILFLTGINNRCPDIPEVLISLGKVLEKKKEYAKASVCYKNIISSNKNAKFTKLAQEALIRIKVREMIENS